MNVTLRHLGKAFETGRPVVDDVSFEIAEGEIFGLVGPSGCGKTTLLRMLAGFIRPDAGDIFFGERRVNDLPPQERREVPSAVLFTVRDDDGVHEADAVSGNLSQGGGLDPDRVQPPEPRLSWRAVCQYRIPGEQLAIAHSDKVG